MTLSSEIPFLDELPDLRIRLARAETLFTDLDGTLLGRGASIVADGEGRPTLDTVTAVVALNTAGLRVVMTSGRTAKQLREASRLLGWSDFIAEMGCVRSYDRGARVVYDTGVWAPDAVRPGETPYEAILRAGAVDLLRERFPGLIEYHDPWHLDREVTHMLRGNVPIAEAQAALDELSLPVTIIDNGIIHPMKHGLVGVDEIHAIHLAPAGTSKQRAVSLDLADRGMSGEDALAIGDSAADVAMAQVVALLAVVSNGLNDPALVERAARFDNVVVTRASHGSGWAELADAWLAAAAS